MAPPIGGMKLTDVLEATAARSPERPAFSDLQSGQTLTYGEVAAQVEAVATFLRAQGVTPGQRIGFVAPNGIGCVVASFAALAAGACVVPVAASQRPAEIAQILEAMAVNGALVAPTAAELVPGDAAVVGGCGDACDGFRYRWIARDAVPPAGLAALDPAFVRFTSGTTAESRGVVLSHRATLARVEAADHVLGLRPDDRILWVLPLAYHFAVTIVGYVRAGAHTLLCSDFRPAALAAAAEQHRATVLYGSPMHFQRLADARAETRFASVRLALSTGTALPAEIARRFTDRFDVPLGQAYGIIEAGLPCINTGHMSAPPTSVGPVVPGYEVAVFADDGTTVAAGTEGEVGVRGAGLFDAYFSPWRLRDDVMRAGWLMTGDVGVFDAASALTLRGRTKAVISVAGMKVFPEEVEARVDSHPAIRESRVFGRPHAHLGEVPYAEVAVHDASRATFDPADLMAYCARELSSWKVPVKIDVVASVPRTPGGKILRRPV
jgi:long-chain acyl-CoA synthetase